MSKELKRFPNWYKRYVFEELYKLNIKYNQNFEYDALVIDDIYDVLSSIKDIDKNLLVLNELSSQPIFEYLYKYFLYKKSNNKHRFNEELAWSSVVSLNHVFNLFDKCHNISFGNLELDFSDFAAYNKFWEFCKIIFPKDTHIDKLSIKGIRGFEMSNAMELPKKCNDVVIDKPDIFARKLEVKNNI